MGVFWAWSFEDESAVLLEEWGFVPDSVNPIDFAPTAVAADLWTYAGAPAAGRSLAIHTNNHQIGVPVEAIPGRQGAIAIPIRVAGPIAGSAGYRILRVESGPAGGFTTYCAFTGATVMSLYVGGVLQGTSQAIDFTTFHYVVLKYDHRANPYLGELWVDGVQEVTGSYPRAPQDTTELTVNGAAAGGTRSTKIGQIIVYSLFADASELSRYATTFEPTADGTNVGFATTVPLGNDFDNVGGILDTATYVEEAAPVANDLVNVTNGTIASQLGITPTTIDAVTVHTLSVGQAISAHAQVGDGVATTDGSDVVIDLTIPTYAQVTATVAPNSGIAWTPTESPELNYEIA